MSDGQTLQVPVAQTEVYVTVRVMNSELFQRDGCDVHSDATVSFTQATLGGKVRIPGLNGQIDIKVSLEPQSTPIVRTRVGYIAS